MHGTSKVDELSKKCIILDGISRLGGEYIVQVLKAFRGRGGKAGHGRSDTKPEETEA